MQSHPEGQSSPLLRRGPLVHEDKDVVSMSEADVYTYFPLPPESLPEAFPKHNKALNLSMLPKSGCTGLQVKTCASLLLSIHEISLQSFTRDFAVQPHGLLHCSLSVFHVGWRSRVGA